MNIKLFEKVVKSIQNQKTHWKCVKITDKNVKLFNRNRVFGFLYYMKLI